MPDNKVLGGMEILVCLALKTADGVGRQSEWVRDRILERTGQDFSVEVIGRCNGYLAKRGLVLRDSGSRGRAMWVLTGDGSRELHRWLDAFLLFDNASETVSTVDFHTSRSRRARKE